jgi:hypothetical protein
MNNIVCIFNLYLNNEFNLNSLKKILNPYKLIHRVLHYSGVAFGFNLIR